MNPSIPIVVSIIVAAGGLAACVAEKQDSAADGASGAPAGGSGGASGAPMADASDGSLGGSGGASGTTGTGGADSGAGDAATEAGDASGDPVLELLGRPHVQDALAAAAAAGYPITTETKSNELPPLTGYYLKPLGEGRFVASGNGANLTSGILGNEIRVTVHSDASVTEASVGFDDVGRFGSIVTSGLLLRGANGDFTLYQSYTLPCPIQGTDRVVEGVSIQSGRFVATIGDWQSLRQINITVAASGARTSSCDQAYAGDTEVPGGWIVSETPRYQRITVADLEYMCVDENAGYVAGEIWTRADTTECSCNADFLVVCG